MLEKARQAGHTHSLSRDWYSCIWPRFPKKKWRNGEKKGGWIRRRWSSSLQNSILPGPLDGGLDPSFMLLVFGGGWCSGSWGFHFGMFFSGVGEMVGRLRKDGDGRCKWFLRRGVERENGRLLLIIGGNVRYAYSHFTHEAFIQVRRVCGHAFLTAYPFFL